MNNIKGMLFNFQNWQSFWLNIKSSAVASDRKIAKINYLKRSQYCCQVINWLLMLYCQNNIYYRKSMINFLEDIMRQQILLKHFQQEEGNSDALPYNSYDQNSSVNYQLGEATSWECINAGLLLLSRLMGYWIIFGKTQHMRTFCYSWNQSELDDSASSWVAELNRFGEIRNRPLETKTK